MPLDKKCQFFVYLHSVKIRLEITLNNFVKEKKPFFTGKEKPFGKSQKWLFSKGVNPCFWSKNANFFCLFRFSEN